MGVLEENTLLQEGETPTHLFSSALLHLSICGARQVTAQVLGRLRDALIWYSKTLQTEAVNVIWALPKVCAKRVP